MQEVLTNVQDKNGEPQVCLFTVNGFAHEMTGIALIVMRLLLFSFIWTFIWTGVKGQDGLILAERGIDISYPCTEDLVCFHIWHFSTSDTSGYAAIISNGKIQRTKSKRYSSECTLKIKDLTAEDIGRDHCKQRRNAFSPNNTPSLTPELTLIPGRVVSLQCVLLTYVQRGYCKVQSEQVNLVWVDEAGAEIQDDSQHQITQKSSCDVTLTLTFQSPGDKTLRCQATVNEQVQTSMELRVRNPGLKGKGRGLTIELEPENQGGNQDTIGAAVGVVGCVVLMAVVAAFVVNRRRTRNQLPSESCYTISNNNVMNVNDLVYAEIILPAGSDHVWVHEHDNTEYAIVRHK